MITNKKVLYGLSAEQYAAMLAQGCEICGSTERGRQGLAIDHDHATGVVRGTLCGPCNRGIGFFRDNPAVLINAALYLQNHQDAGRLEVRAL
jgi:hypothetical protein